MWQIHQDYQYLGKERESILCRWGWRIRNCWRVEDENVCPDKVAQTDSRCKLITQHQERTFGRLTDLSSVIKRQKKIKLKICPFWLKLYSMYYGVNSDPLKFTHWTPNSQYFRLQLLCGTNGFKEVMDALELSLQVVMSYLTWVLAPELGSSERAVCALNCQPSLQLQVLPHLGDRQSYADAVQFYHKGLADWFSLCHSFVSQPRSTTETRDSARW